MSQECQTADFFLEPEVLGALCRRGRRRLRDIQASTEATLKLDRARGVLQVKGTHKEVQNVHWQLESLTGPCMPITPALWAELMRTRVNLDPVEAAVARIQQASGCRIHIERNVQQIRLFGPQDSIVAAQKLLEILHGMCVEVYVDMDSPLSLDLEVVQGFAQEFAVTLQLEEKRICVLGISGAVNLAAEELRKLDSKEPCIPLQGGKPADLAQAAIVEALSKLVLSESVGSTTASSEEDAPKSAQVPFPTNKTDATPVIERVRDGVLTSKPATTPMPKAAKRIPQAGPSQNMKKVPFSSEMPSQDLFSAAKLPKDSHQSSGPCVTCGVSAKFCVHCGEVMAQNTPGGCLTCGASKFCVHCGKPTERFINSAMPPAPEQQWTPKHQDWKQRESSNGYAMRPNVRAMRPNAHTMRPNVLQDPSGLDMTAFHMATLQAMQQHAYMQFMPGAPLPSVVPEGSMMMCVPVQLQ